MNRLRAALMLPVVVIGLWVVPPSSLLQAAPEVTVTLVSVDNVQLPPSTAGFAAVFRAQSSDTNTVFVAFTCTATGSLSCTDVAPSTYIFDWEVQETEVTVGYATLGVGPGTITLTASYGGQTRTADLHANVVPDVAPTVAFQLPSAAAGRAVVANRQPVVRAFITPGTFPIDTNAVTLEWRGQNVSSLARFNTRMVEWEVDSLHRLGIGDSALIMVRACSLYGACSSAARWAVLLNNSKPVLGFTGVALGSTGAGFGAPFGVGTSVKGVDVETGFTTVPYFMMGQSRAASLVYSTRQAYPRATIPVDVELAGALDSLILRLRSAAGGTVMDSRKIVSPSCFTGGVRYCRAVLQADFTSGSYATPTRQWLFVDAQAYGAGGPWTSTDSVETVLVDRRQTEYGSGWWPAVLAKVVPAGNDRLLIQPNGAASIFRGSTDSVYLSPPGNFSILRKAGTGTELSARGAIGRIVFDDLGRVLKVVDQNGNRDSMIYSSNSDRILRLRDPVNNEIQFVYTSSKLDTIHSPGGRSAKISIDGSNRLTSSTALVGFSRSYTTGYAYNSFAGGAQVLRYVHGILADTTFIEWDPTWLYPTQAKLPKVLDETNTVVQPIIAYMAYERQGLTSLRPLDSLYVEVKDPRNNWTRSLLNRYGQALKTWDVLGPIGRNSYTPEGLLVWSEGKNGDSSRAYVAYDSLRRIKRNFIVRGPSDTLVTSTYSYLGFLVSQVHDSRGKASSFYYDGKQNLYRTEDPVGNGQFRTFDSTGQVATVQQSGDAGTMTYDYYPGTRQVLRVRDRANLTVDSVLYDQYGRDTLHYSRLRVSYNPAHVSNQYQWRALRKKYSLDNLVETVRAQQSKVCIECAYPQAFTDTIFWPKDSLHNQVTSYSYDVAGRDTARTGNLRLPSRTSRDRLGRVRAYWIWMDSVGVVDSMYYDVAGNLVKRKTRGDHEITSAYDSRNRVQSTVIETVGTLYSIYGGPQDQLTRLYYTGRVDSVGGTNGDLKWAYDARGRLKADTTFYGTFTPHQTLYSYDTYERLNQVTNQLGAWKTRYETNRGLADTLITPFADTVLYTYDARGRAVGPTIMNNGARLTRTPRWTSTGQLDSIINIASSTTGGGTQWTAGVYVQGGGNSTLTPAIFPRWDEKRGPGGTSYTWSDSVMYDGWDRVTSWIGRRGSTVMVRDTFKFDANENLKSKSFSTQGGETYNKLDRQTGRTVSTCTYTHTFDRVGNLTKAVCGPTTYDYGYNALNQLVSVRRNNLLMARYAYDASGRRIAKRVYSTASGGVTGYTRFVYNGQQVSFETDSAGTIGQRYTWGLAVDDLLAIRAGSTNYYVVQDQLRSVRGIISGSSWKVSLTYAPYGEIVDSASSGISGLTLRYRWVGREYDQETKFYYMRARYYSIGQGRFISEDPVRYGGGPNLYSYVNGNVQSSRDPSGMVPDSEQYRECYPGECYHVGTSAWTTDFNNDGIDDLDDLMNYVWGLKCNLPGGCIEYTQDEATQTARSECLADKTCRQLENSVNKSGSRVKVSNSTCSTPENLPCGSLAHHDKDTGIWTVPINFAAWASVAANPLIGSLYKGGVVGPITGSTVLAHEFAHVDYGIRTRKGWSAAESNRRAVRAENEVRSRMVDGGCRRQHNLNQGYYDSRC